MFDALAQLIVIFVCGLFGLIGAVITWDHFNWKKRGRKMRATLIGLREQMSEMRGKNSNAATMLYYPVIEYVGPGGQTIRAESDTGASSYIKMMPGKKIMVLIRDEKPEQFRPVGNTALLFGFVFTLIGLGGLAFAFRSFETTIYTPILGGLVLVWFAFKVRKIIKPRSEWEKPEDFSERKSAELKAEREALPLLDAAAIRARQRNTEETQRRFAWVPLLAGSIFCGVSYFIWQDTGGNPDQGEMMAIGLSGGIGALVVVSTLFSLARSGSRRL